MRKINLRSLTFIERQICYQCHGVVFNDHLKGNGGMQCNDCSLELCKNKAELPPKHPAKKSKAISNKLFLKSAVRSRRNSFS